MIVIILLVFVFSNCVRCIILFLSARVSLISILILQIQFAFKVFAGTNSVLLFILKANTHLQRVKTYPSRIRILLCSLAIALAV